MCCGRIRPSILITALTSSSAASEQSLCDKGSSARYVETVPRKGYRFIEAVTAQPEARPANEPHHWSRPVVTYAAIAILVAIVVILFVRTRYDKFVASGRSPASPAVPAR
jgi:hypothetical protein